MNNLIAICIRITKKEKEQLKKLKNDFGVTLRHVLLAGIDSFLKKKKQVLKFTAYKNEYKNNF